MGWWRRVHQEHVMPIKMQDGAAQTLSDTPGQCKHPGQTWLPAWLALTACLASPQLAQCDCGCATHPIPLHPTVRHLPVSSSHWSAQRRVLPASLRSVGASIGSKPCDRWNWLQGRCSKRGRSGAGREGVEECQARTSPCAAIRDKDWTGGKGHALYVN